MGVDTIISLFLLGLIIFGVIMVIAFWKKIINFFNFSGKVPLGGACKLATDCKGWGEFAQNIVCCDGKCTKPGCTKLGAGYCPKDCCASYGRGAGSVPKSCGDEENDSGLCYKKCKSGYKGVGPVCWQECPSGFKDFGLYCSKPPPYGRGAGYISKGLCEKHHSSCEKYGALWYPKCRSGFHNFGCCVCSPNCPSGMTDEGEFCYKSKYGRGAGTVPSKCPSGEVLDAGLCYPKCRNGYKGVGPVCWPDGCKK